MSIDFIKICKDEKLLRRYLTGLSGGLQSWSSWFACGRVVYGLPVHNPRALRLIKECTGRDISKLSKNGYTTVILFIGRRGGKSKMSAGMAINEALFSGREKFLSSGERGLVSVISPSRFQSKIVLGYISGALHGSEILESQIVREDRESILLNNGVMIQILTGDFKSSRGFTQLCVIVEELNFFCISEESRVKNAAELVNSIRPSLLTTGGKLICISTKYRKSGWGFRQWQKYYGKDNDRTLVWTAPTTVMNPTISESEIQELVAEDPSAGRAEFLDCWREDIEQFLPIEVIQACVIAGRKQLLPIGKKFSYFAFADCSGGRNDSAALAIAHLRDDKTQKGAVVIDFLKQYKSPHSPSEVVERQSVELKKYGLNRVTGDAYSAQWVVDAFKNNNGIIYEKSKLNKSQLFLEVLPRLCSPNGIELLDDNEVTVKQFASLERKTRSGGRDSIGCPSGSGFHDDVCNVIAGAAFISSEKKKRAGVFLHSNRQLDEMSNARILSSIY